MLRWAKLLLVAVLAFAPLLESLDTWEHPWSGDSSGEMVFTLISCALAIGYAAVRRLIPPLLNLVLREIVYSDSSITLIVKFIRQQTAPQPGRASPFPSSPLRI